MAEMPSAEGGHDQNFPAHARNYEGFLKILKWGTIFSAIVAAVVVYIIAN
ncbi:MAG: aa3-type cytochrome c oxidase subunit IV [Sphingomicrobium sp.]